MRRLGRIRCALHREGTWWYNCGQWCWQASFLRGMEIISTATRPAVIIAAISEEIVHGTAFTAQALCAQLRELVAVTLSATLFQLASDRRAACSCDVSLQAEIPQALLQPPHRPKEAGAVPRRAAFAHLRRSTVMQPLQSPFTSSRLWPPR